MPRCSNPKLGSLLHAYEVDTLPEEDLERFEIHLISCTYCFKQVHEFENVASVLREDEDVRSLVRGASRQPVREPGEFWMTLWRYLWPEAPLVMKPALVYLLALALLVPAYHGFRGGKGPDQTIHPVQMLNFFPLRDAEEKVFTRTAGEDGMISFYCMGTVPGNPYQVIIKSEDNVIIFQDDHYDRFNEQSTGWLSLPLTTMSPGKYTLSISDTDPQSRTVQEYSFLIKD